MHKFPQLLPCPLRRSYSIDDLSGIQRTEMESGHVDQVNKLTERLQVATLSWIFTEEEYEYIFEPFIWNTLNGGTSRFVIKVKDSSISPTKEIIAKIRPEGRKIYNSTKTEDGLKWRVTLTCDFENVGVIDNSTAQVIELNIIAKRLCKVSQGLIEDCL